MTSTDASFRFRSPGRADPSFRTAWFIETQAIESGRVSSLSPREDRVMRGWRRGAAAAPRLQPLITRSRSEEHTSELQSLAYLVCPLLLVKKISVMVSAS